MRFDEMLGIKESTLDEIALSLNPRPDKDSTGHGYTAYYDKHFTPLRDKPIKLLEIGVWEGASLLMWKRYFPNGRIHGADIDLSRCPADLEDPPRVRLWECNQSSKESLVNMALELGPWDIIIDDGSHNPDHQITTFGALWPYLNAGGLYCVEDLHVNYTFYADAPSRMVDYIGKVLQDNLHGRGKTKFASIANSPIADQDKLDRREREIESIHLYRYLAIIQKR